VNLAAVARSSTVSTPAKSPAVITSSIVKKLRLWLLVLLAVLLPLRSALAGAMLCHVAGSGTQTEARFDGQAHLHAHAAASALHHAHAGDGTHGHAAEDGPGDVRDASHEPASGGGDKCNLCSAFCSVTALVGGIATLPQPPELSGSFPRIDAPPPSFVSGGQERPPRSL
jgi:hypothetical protein